MPGAEVEKVTHALLRTRRLSADGRPTACRALPCMRAIRWNRWVNIRLRSPIPIKLACGTSGRAPEHLASVPAGTRVATVADYSLLLFDSGRGLLATEDFAADSDEEVFGIATAVANACSDICTSYEVWRGFSLRVSATTSWGASLTTRLNERAQLIALDRELTLRDSRSRVARSRQLMREIDQLVSSVCQMG